MARLSNESKTSYHNLIRKDRMHYTGPKSLTGRARALQAAVGISEERDVLIRDFQKFEEFLDTQIVVVSAEHGDKVTYEGLKKRDKKIFLYHADLHFHSIVDINSFFPKKIKLCLDCLNLCSRRKKHSCTKSCGVCEGKNCIFDDSSVLCEKCNNVCRNSECLARHMQVRKYKTGPRRGREKPSLCDTYHRCVKCKKTIDITARCMSLHKCSEFFCKGCSEYVSSPNHMCYHRAPRPKPEQQQRCYLFYDFESSQNEIFTCGNFKPDPKEGCLECGKDSAGVKVLCASCRRCRSCRSYACGLQEHKPLYLIAQSACDACKNDKMTPESTCFTCGRRCNKCIKKDKEGNFINPPCNNGQCGLREAIFEGVDCGDNFAKFLFSKQHEHWTAIAHNFQGYDSMYILNYLVRNGFQPSVIFTGSKLMYLKVGEGLNVRCIDSLNFLTMKLKEMPKAMGLDASVCKGDFCYGFACLENFNYIGPMPAVHYYGIEKMSTSERSEFLKWHESQKDAVFNFRDEILKYTRSDVEILRLACMKYRDMMIRMTESDEMAGIDPFQSITMSSAAMTMFKQLFLKEDWEVTLDDGRQGLAEYRGGVWTWKGSDEKFSKEDITQSKFIKSDLPSLPTRNYEGQQNHSLKAIIWLEYLSRKMGKEIRHARNHGEHRLFENSRMTCDGYLPPESGEGPGTCFSFNGCFIHGCLCQPAKSKNPKTGHTRETAYYLTCERNKKITAAGYKLVTIWECEYDRLVKSDPDLQKIAKNLDIPPCPLNIKDAFFGGRTETFKLHYEASETSKCNYVDFTSLYPAMNKGGRYATDHCKIYTRDLDYTLEKYFGFAQCKVLAPRGLLIPILPYRCNGRLKFALCRTCAEKETSKPCKCNTEKRAFTGTWATIELKAALEAGYTLLKLYTVFHYDETSQYDPVTKKGGLFTSYMNKMAQIKVESSDWPAWVRTEEDKDRYLQLYEEKEGIRLTKENICSNVALKNVAKKSLNVLW